MILGLLAYLLPCIYAGIAADYAEQGTVMAVLQCLFYPLLVPLMRYQVRNDEDIDVCFHFMFDSCVFCVFCKYSLFLF